MAISSDFFNLLHRRRSRRFCLGMKNSAGPFAYESRFKPVPLRLEDEARLAFAAAGYTGHVLADLEISEVSGANIMAGMAGRTVASGDAIQTVALVVINDTGAFLLRRPGDLAPDSLKRSLGQIEIGDYPNWYLENRVQIADRRVSPQLEPLFNIQVNRWSLGAAGTTYFLPINDSSFLYINGLLEILNDQTRAWLLDDRSLFCPAGLSRFAQSRGGHLMDDLAAGRAATISLVERMVTEFVTVEQGMMLQNLALAAEELGLGGYPNFANHDTGWTEALGFRTVQIPASRYLGAGALLQKIMGWMGRDSLIPCAVGLERNGEILLRSFAPPYFNNMREAVLAVVSEKKKRWTSSQPNAAKLPVNFPQISPRAIEAATAYCEYVFQRFGRFPAQLPAFKTVVGFQVGYPDLDFYAAKYQAGVVSEKHREVFRMVTGQPADSSSH